MSTWQDYLVDDDAALARILRESRTIAVLGPGVIPKTPSGKLRRAHSVALLN